MAKEPFEQFAMPNEVRAFVEQSVAQARAAFDGIANAATRVVLFTPEGHEDRIGTQFNGSFACDNVEATYRQLKERGVEFVAEPQKQPWGEFAIFKDPDGNQFVLSSAS